MFLVKNSVTAKNEAFRSLIFNETFARPMVVKDHSAPFIFLSKLDKKKTHYTMQCLKNSSVGNLALGQILKIYVTDSKGL